VVPEAGNQHFFYLKNLTVELSKTEVDKTSWTGTLCDHQNPMMQADSCAGWLCFNQKCSVLLDMIVTFNSVDTNVYHNQYSVPHFRFWRITSKVFIQPTAMTVDNKVFLFCC
jgi:hypothetical protein